MNDWLRTAGRPDVAARGPNVDAVLGTILPAVNRGEVLPGGNPDPLRR